MIYIVTQCNLLSGFSCHSVIISIRMRICPYDKGYNLFRCLFGSLAFGHLVLVVAISVAHMFSSLEKVKQMKANQPYQKPFLAHVTCIGEKIQYKKQKDKYQEFWIVGLADSSTFLWAIVYSASVRAAMIEGKCYIISNFIIRKDYNGTSVILTSKSLLHTTLRLQAVHLGHFCMFVPGQHIDTVSFANIV